MLRRSWTILKIHTPENSRDRGQREDGEREGEREREERLNKLCTKEQSLGVITF